MTNRVNVLIVGSGAYVCGRGIGSFGTVLPALLQGRADGVIGDIHAVGRHPESVQDISTVASKVAGRLGVKPDVVLHVGFSSEQPEKYTALCRHLPSPLAAIVVTPDHVHAPIARALIDAGTHTLVVKPLASTVREARELADQAQRMDVYGAVEFHKRFDEANLLLRRSIEEGSLGDLCYVDVEYSQRRSVPENTFIGWIEHTNIFQYLGVHYVDIVSFVTRAEPRRALALAQSSYLAHKGIETPDAIQALVEWEMPNGRRFTASFLTHWVDPLRTSAMSNQTITVVGTGGRYESDQKRRGVQVVTDAAGVEDINPYFTQMFRDGTGRSVVAGYGPRSIIQFVRDVAEIHAGRIRPRDLADVRPTFREAILSTAVIEAVNCSLAQNGAWQDITPCWRTS
jgi:predicted dehydrogenase